MTRSRRSRVTPEQVGQQLRDAREGKGLSVDDIARVTKVPVRSLAALERGAFDELPADVFARGFLRAYARCVGLDGDAIVRAYADSRAAADAGGRGAPAESASGRTADAVGGDARDAVGGDARDAVGGDARDAAGGDARDAVDGEARDAGSRSRLQSTGAFVARHLFDDRAGDGARRGAVTLAVIILVIVATLTMSYLLRGPTSASDGLTRARPAPGAAVAAAPDRARGAPG
ncbi:MAG: helix-turn-helix domain-containing protein [Deltaproteobacteria bacterium]|nr:MAG: helix-turn-helix domain-containing protein [Deltaproteobacteria bacterium]